MDPHRSLDCGYGIHVFIVIGMYVANCETRGGDTRARPAGRQRGSETPFELDGAVMSLRDASLARPAISGEWSVFGGARLARPAWDRR
jgi:hypothetical protein